MVLRRSAYLLLVPLVQTDPGASSVEATREVESEIYGDEFSICKGAVSRLFRVCHDLAGKSPRRPGSGGFG